MSHCAECSKDIEDEKQCVCCTSCKGKYHAKCEGVDLRGFHLRKNTWTCRICCNQNIQDALTTSEESDEPVSNYEIMKEILSQVRRLNAKTDNMQIQLDSLLVENKMLKEEIFSLKGKQDKKSDLSYSSVAQDKLLLINPKDKNNMGNSDKTKSELRDKINPTDIGITIRNETKSGGVVLQCQGTKDIEIIKEKIQTNLGKNFEVKQNIKRNRLKIVGINEEEHTNSNETLIQKILKQNDLEINKSQISIVYKTKIKKKLFNLVIEINSFVYEKLQTNRKISIGWSCCPFFDDLGIVRCYSCWSYGHFARTCNKIACPTCSENHSKCNNENKKNV